MKANISIELLELLKRSPSAPPWRCKIQLPNDHTLYGCRIAADGEITCVGDRTIYSEADLGFRPALIQKITIY
jgi:hypothetical protein